MEYCPSPRTHPGLDSWVWLAELFLKGEYVFSNRELFTFSRVVKQRQAFFDDNKVLLRLRFDNAGTVGDDSSLEMDVRRHRKRRPHAARV